MIRDGFISIYGVTTEDYVEGDPLPCPKCGMSSAKVIRGLEFEPQSFRLGCIHCGYEVPEDLAVYSNDSKEGIDGALDVWNRLSIYSKLEKEAAKANDIIAEFNKEDEEVE